MYLKTPQDILPFCQDILGLDQEGLFVVALKANNTVIERRLITFGILDASLAHPREVFRYAIVRNTAKIVLVHNHPSGNNQPSVEDLRITKQLIQAGTVIGIRVIDHLILGDPQDVLGMASKIFSIRETGLCDFNFTVPS